MDDVAPPFDHGVLDGLGHGLRRESQIGGC